MGRTGSRPPLAITKVTRLAVGKPSAVAAYAFGCHEHRCASLGFHHAVEFVPILVSTTRSDEDTPEQPGKLSRAEVLQSILWAYELDRALHRYPVGAVPNTTDALPLARRC